MKLSNIGTINDTVQYHSDLLPTVWTQWEMNPVIRNRLMEIAKVFINYLEIEDFKTTDIVLTGSLANFNYTKFSDFDLHVVTDYKDLKCDDLAEALYRAKKQIWNDQHDITIIGHEVELYIEDVNHSPVSAGIFSILKNKWVKQPEFARPEYSKQAVNRKAQSLIDLISKTIRYADSDDEYNRVIEKLRRMRRSGLDRGGEFSTENLAFKVLRNTKWIDRLHDAASSFTDNTLSIK